MGQRSVRPTHFGRHLEAFLEERGVGPSQLYIAARFAEGDG